MLSLKKSGKMISDIFQPSKFIYSQAELSTGDHLTPDGREALQKELKQERLLQLLSLYLSNDSARQVHLYDKQQSEIVGDDDRLQRPAKPASSKES